MRQRWRAAAARRAAGQDEGGERGEIGVHGVDLPFQPRHLRFDDAQPLAAGLVGRGEVGTEVEEVVLDAAEHGVEPVRQRRLVQTGESDMGVEFVDGADRLEAQVGFRPPLAGRQRRGAVVAGAGVDAVERPPSQVTARRSRGRPS